MVKTLKRVELQMHATAELNKYIKALKNSQTYSCWIVVAYIWLLCVDLFLQERIWIWVSAPFSGFSLEIQNKTTIDMMNNIHAFILIDDNGSGPGLAEPEIRWTGASQEHSGASLLFLHTFQSSLLKI